MSNPNAPYHRIGTIDVDAGEVRKSYEVAAWWTRFEYPAQTVEVKTNGYYVTWTVKGHDVETYTPSLYGGVPVGKGGHTHDRKASTYTFRPYAYEVATMMFENPDPRITLDDDVTIVGRSFDHKILCRGYEPDYTKRVGESTYAERYPNCECEYHLDCHGNRAYHRDHWNQVRTNDDGSPMERNERGHLPTGYKPHEVDTKIHYRFDRIPTEV